MVLLDLIKQCLNPEKPFEEGHPVQLLIYLFNQFNQESIIFLRNELETILPPIPNESKKLTDEANKMFKSAYKTHEYYENATDEEKEYIEQEIKKQKKQKQQKQKINSENKQTELDDENSLKSSDKRREEWMDREQFQTCDLQFRRASKLSPKCIKCYLKHIIFLFQCKKISMANDIFEKALTVIHNLQKSKKQQTKKMKPKKKSKLSKHSHSHMNEMNILTISELNTIETLITFYFGYLYYMSDDIDNFNKYLQKCLDLEPNNIGIRCQYIVCLITQIEYEKAYIYIMETLKLLNEKENEYIKNQKQITEKEKNNKFNTIDIIKYYRMICGIGAASIRLIFGIDYKMVTQHLQFVMENDELNLGIIKYCLSYSLYKNGEYDLSNHYYNQFIKYINQKKANALKNKKEANDQKQNTKTESEIEENYMNDAASKLSIDCFKWHPNTHKDNISEFLDLSLDLIVVCVVMLIIYYIVGYRPHFGNNIMDWFVICIMLIISCGLCSPSLGILLIIVSLPPYNNSDFNYLMFGTKWLCVSAGMLFIYRVVINGEMPRLWK